ncbi:cysteinyl-tRNA synthetase [Neolentinus lepideus HHB14362 ss-1]|uniref:cysteine--tRNA ligase n=1 Tax=Neolentinus lepideus HHB14362 ss-1 TaxID=1314782 RepID=A0A165V541_9AGAM|nr:cysteinyl-tRNA synthetase [Neolentinus lepideus HHB14362 ss-1]
MSAVQPSWAPPIPQADEPVLKVYNSLTRSKTQFTPKNGRHVKWYNCGPTVYDASHMGHARNYVTQDVLRRIMTDYFGYDVHFVMNITDIEDKIIIRARQNHLYNSYLSKVTALNPTLIEEVRSAWAAYLQSKLSKGLPEGFAQDGASSDELFDRIREYANDSQWRSECLKRDEKFSMHLTVADRSFTALSTASRQLADGQTDAQFAQTLVEASSDVLSEWLDKQFKTNVTDHSIFRSLSSYWEDRFFEDMSRLRVREPDTITRVTEYVPEIVSYVQRIIENGYAYEVDGSVYFDTRTFDGTDGHFYAKLEPWSKGNQKLIEEGEGALTDSLGRRSPSDFALWKASKPGEPAWPSPWGPGRPGWHIECSVMATAVLGENIDIHSGGIDLAFPHHDNEMAQSEAYHNHGPWVNYFLHTGHLHIEGLKMSKSLKNFITIDEILRKYTARQLRLAFLTQQWNARMDFSESLMTGEVKSIETGFNNFFSVVKALLMDTDCAKADGQHRYGEAEQGLIQHLHASQTAFRTALCDSFNTPGALEALRTLVSRTNTYINSPGKDLNIKVVEYVAKWVGRMLRIFGLGEGELSEIGWGQDLGKETTAINREEILMPYLRTLSSFRDGVRKLAIAKGDSAFKDILALCDKLRDVDLVPLGVALDDQEDGKALVKIVSPEELMQAREEKRKQAEARAAKKVAQVESERQKRIQKLEKGRVPPEEIFKPPNVQEGAYRSWNGQGLPLTDGEGKELSKNQNKKNLHAWAMQKDLHEKYLAWKRDESA